MQSLFTDEELTDQITRAAFGPDGEKLLQLFHFAHLRDDLRLISRPFAELALNVAISLPRNAERTLCLRALRQAKDQAVTAFLWRDAP